MRTNSVNKNIVKSYDCVLTKESWISLDYLMIDSDGCVDLIFSPNELSEELKDKRVKCKFDSYIHLSVLDEFYDVDNVVYEGLSENESLQGKFGPIILYEDSPWINRFDRHLFFDEKYPYHFLIISTDDVIEIISKDEPRFSILNEGKK